MLSPTGNPTASNLFSVLSTVQKAAGVHLAVAAGRKLLILSRIKIPIAASRLKKNLACCT